MCDFLIKEFMYASPLILGPILESPEEAFGAGLGLRLFFIRALRMASENFDSSIGSGPIAVTSAYEL